MITYPDSRRIFPWLALPAAGVAGLAMVPITSGPTLCPFALITGTACPGCGLTRAAVSLARGDLVSALTFHPLILVVALWALGWWVTGLVRRRGREVRLDPRLINRLLVASGVAFIALWLVRLGTGTLPPV